MLQYFKKLEKFDVTLADVDHDLHGFNGPVRISNPPYHTPLADAFVKAGKEMGFKPVDYNGRSTTGFAYMQSNQINGERLSTNRAYLHPARNRKNLFATMYSHVNKVLIDPKTKTAYGVEFDKFGKTIRVMARKEVIVSAGAINSPQILMLSGIGPAAHLESMNIKVIQDLPVGENLMDHIAYGGLTFLVNETVGIIPRNFFRLNNPTIPDYLNKRTGQLTAAGGIEGLGFINVDDMSPENEIPNIELMFAPVSLLSDYFIHVPFGIQQNYFKKSFSDKLYKHAWFCWPLLMRPKSKGKILLRSRDPRDKPKIFANYYSDPEDVRVSIKGIRMAIELSKTKAMTHFNSQLLDLAIPDCEMHVPDSDEYWECALRTYTMTIWHHSGTCKMGKEDDPTTVVNSKLQVGSVAFLIVGGTV